MRILDIFPFLGIAQKHNIATVTLIKNSFIVCTSTSHVINLNASDDDSHFGETDPWSVRFCNGIMMLESCINVYLVILKYNNLYVSMCR